MENSVFNFNLNIDWKLINLISMKKFTLQWILIQLLSDKAEYTKKSIKLYQ